MPIKISCEVNLLCGRLEGYSVVMEIDNAQAVQQEYSEPDRLLERFKVCREYMDGHTAYEEVLVHVARHHPKTVLEVGCGDGSFSAMLRDFLDVEVKAVDVTPSMVERAALRGIDVQVADVQHLPFEDNSFDVVVANWMLYHVPNLSRGLDEIQRVLKPGGAVIASTLAPNTLREVWELVGGDDGFAPNLKFDTVTGRTILERHFDSIEQFNISGIVVFPDRDAVIRYIEATLTRHHLAEKLPEFDGKLHSQIDNSIFVAKKRQEAQGTGDSAVA